jgi:transposase
MDTNGSGRRRRSWPEALKREVVAASFEPGASVSLIARRYDVNTNQLFIWRRRYRDGMQDVSGAVGPELLPVKITEERVAEPRASPPVSGDKVEIELPNGYRIRIDPSIDVKALRRIVDVLERR